MATSLYDRPLYGEKYHSSRGIGNYDDDDVNYDAVRDAKEKFYRHPEKYAPRRVYRPYDTSTSSGYTRRELTRIYVVVEHGGGCNSGAVCDDLRLAIEDTFPDVRFAEKRGRFDSFEVFINGRCLYSRLAQGGYPYEDEVIDAVYRAKKGKTFYPLERGSTTCAIL